MKSPNKKQNDPIIASLALRIFDIKKLNKKFLVNKKSLIFHISQLSDKKYKKNQEKSNNYF